jgi:hypothetical protein
MIDQDTVAAVFFSLLRTGLWGICHALNVIYFSG